MKITHLLFFSFSLLTCSMSISGQNIIINDTTTGCQTLSIITDNSSFTVIGEVVGLDTGALQVKSRGGKVLISRLPVRNGKFCFSGFVSHYDVVSIMLENSYYVHSFWIEPGVIKIQTDGYAKFMVSGTEENDAFNYFRDTINKENAQSFIELRQKIEDALIEGNLDLYLGAVNSLISVQNDYLKLVKLSVRQHPGYYILTLINNNYISGDYFKKRKQIFNELSEAIKNSPAGQKGLEYLKQDELESRSLVNKPAYWFTLKDKNGQSINLNQFKGKIIVLDFWASWCVPCIKALPLLKKIQQDPVSLNVVYISVSVDKKEGDWKKKESEIGIPWISLLADKETKKEYGINPIPNYIIINKKGAIVSKSSSLYDAYTTLKKIREGKNK